MRVLGMRVVKDSLRASGLVRGLGMMVLGFRV